jgi:hypothetical protein
VSAHFAYFLRKIGNASAVRNANRTRVGVFFARDQAKNCGFARTVGPDETDFVASANLKSRAFE